MLYDSARNRGYLYDALIYDSKKKRKASKKLEMLSEDEDFEEEEKESILNFFKRCVLPKERAAVEKKMHETKAFRRNMVLNQFEKYKNCWQFYFVLPDLVGKVFNFENVQKPYENLFSSRFC